MYISEKNLMFPYNSNFRNMFKSVFITSQSWDFNILKNSISFVIFYVQAFYNISFCHNEKNSVKNHQKIGFFHYFTSSRNKNIYAVATILCMTVKCRMSTLMQCEFSISSQKNISPLSIKMESIECISAKLCHASP